MVSVASSGSTSIRQTLITPSRLSIWGTCEGSLVVSFFQKALPIHTLMLLLVIIIRTLPPNGTKFDHFLFSNQWLDMSLRFVIQSAFRQTGSPRPAPGPGDPPGCGESSWLVRYPRSGRWAPPSARPAGGSSAGLSWERGGDTLAHARQPAPFAEGASPAGAAPPAARPRQLPGRPPSGRRADRALGAAVSSPGERSVRITHALIARH